MWSVMIIVLKKGQGLNNDNKKLAGANVVEPARLWELLATSIPSYHLPPILLMIDLERLSVNQ